MKILEWNVNRASVSRFRRQAEALAGRGPDIVALAEVGIRAGPRLGELLEPYGFEHVFYSQDLVEEGEETASGVAFASRWPFEVLGRAELGVPYPDRTLSAVFETPFGELEGHVVHVVPGSSNGWVKVEFFEAIYERLARESRRPRFLCGDFNSPKDELADGTVEVFGQSRGQRWVEAERSVIEGLSEHGLSDVYRALHGYEREGWSHKNVYDGELKWRRRFDHLFASPQLNPVAAEYLHGLDEHSDHTPLEVVFEPEADDADPAEETSGTTQEREVIDNTQQADGMSMLGLSYEEDVRSTTPNESGHRRGRFKVGWRKAVAGEEYGESVLRELTWQNLGWRLGRLFGEAEEEQIEAMYDWCVEQQ